MDEGYIPRLDTELDEPGMREYVDTLVLAEMEIMASEGMDESFYLSKLPLLPVPILSPVLLAELEAVACRRSRPAAPHLEKPIPPPPPPPIGTNPLDPSVWRRLAERAEVSLEYQSLYALNLEIASLHAVDTWKNAVGDTRALVERLRGDALTASSNVDAINVERAVAQEAVVVRLEGLRKRLREVQGSNTALARAVGGREGVRAKTNLMLT